MLGCLLYELCALEKPFSADNISVLMQKILKEEPKPLPNKDYSPFISKLIALLLQKNQQKRPEIEEILCFREIRQEIKELASAYEKIFDDFAEKYCGESLNLLQAPQVENKKKSLVKPLSYSTLPGVDVEKHSPQEKVFTPHHPKVSENNDKNSILNVIMKQQAKKQTVFSNELKKPAVFNEELDNSAEDFVGLQKSRVSFEQYLNKKLEKPENPEENKKKILRDSHKKLSEKLDEPQKSPLKKLTSHNLDPQLLNRKPQNLEIIEERSPFHRVSEKTPGFEEEEKRNAAKILSVSPTNLTKLKKNSPKAVPSELLSEVSSQRSKLFVEFLKERLGEEKLQKIKALLQNEGESCGFSQVIERRRNEIIEIIGIKNSELIKYLGVLLQNVGDNAEKRKTTADSMDVVEKPQRDEGRVERTSSGYAKLEGFQKKMF